MQILEKYRPPKFHREGAGGLLSVIVTAYNIEAYIERGVRSVCEQTYRDLEIIVVDDGSTDRTGEICDRLAAEDSRVLVIHKENEGPAQARNVGTAAAHGSYIGYVDGDDWIDADMYEKLLGALADQKADIAICRYRQVAKDRTIDGSTDRAVLFEGQEALAVYVEEREEFQIQNAAWNKLYRREILEHVTFPAGKWYEDILFATAALARAGRCIYLDTALYNYIIDREGSIMNCRINPRTFTDQIPAYREKTAFLRELGRADLALAHDYFFYKRLLLFYGELRGQNETPVYLRELETILRQEKERALAAFAVPCADRRDLRKLRRFYRSPESYYRRLTFDEQVVIPLKRQVRKMLGFDK
ncbi:MAG: glycosyltransferase [Bacteroidales bacterium]|nr:glycosyltransferase [Bacteroidales bacterium]MCM1414576.1 glycosyltransferase [bacterium]MCM1422626.1 glycosyltransferase [bacterium]